MHTFLDAKTMAKALRSALADRRIDVTHSDSLELVARQFGFDNWNILAARIEAARQATLPPDWLLHQEGQRLYSIATLSADPLMLALDAKDGSRLAFDNLLQMPDAALTGTFGWTPISVALPVADPAESVSYGVLLKGRGRLQIRAPHLAPVAGGGTEAVAA